MKNKRMTKHLVLVFALVGSLAVMVGPTSAQGPPLPTSCQEIRDANPTAIDGDYEIYPPEQVFTVYCQDMAGTPREYLNLMNTGGGNNFSNAEQDATRSLTTWFEKVRIDPQTLLVDIGDRTFSTSEGHVVIGPNTLFSISYAIAFDCVWYNSSTGKANIDLTGTPFAVIDTFFVDGYYPAGTAVFSSADQVVNLQGGGYCGWIGPGDQRPDPFAGSGPLELKYIGPRRVNIDIKPGSEPNCFNSDSHGVIPVAILGGADFDASTVDPFSVTLDGAIVREKGKSGNAGSLDDVNGDGFQDLVVQILDDAAYTTGDTQAKLVGSTYDGVDIAGIDSICIVP